MPHGFGLVTGSYQVSPSPSLQKSLTHCSSMVDSNPPPLQTPLALTQAYCSLSAAGLNSDCWLEVETEKEALGVFIETLSFTRTITALPHKGKERETNWLLVSRLWGSVHTRTHFVPLRKVAIHSWCWCVAVMIDYVEYCESQQKEFIEIIIPSPVCNVLNQHIAYEEW